jgi:parallel beta-helix repeat protein
MPRNEKLSRRNFLFGTAAFGIGGIVPFNIIDVTNLGAVGDGATDVSDVLQAAIDSLSEHGGVVFMPAGRYIVSRSIEIRVDGVTLQGEGMGATILQLRDGVDEHITGIVRTAEGQISKNITVQDLTIDGNRQNQAADQNQHYGFYSGVTPDQPHTDEDIMCHRVEIRNCSGYGFDPHEVTTRLHLIDCISHHNGIDGFTLDACVDTVVRGCIAYYNDRHGFNLVTNTHNSLLSENTAHNNGGNGFTVQNGSHDNQLVNNTSYRNAEDGILLVSVDDHVVSANYIYENGTFGIRIRGCPNTTITSNRLRNNTQAEDDEFDEIHITDDEDRGSVQCMIANNHITVTGETRARHCIYESAGDGATIQNENMYSSNKAFGSVSDAYRLEGRRAAIIGNA